MAIDSNLKVNALDFTGIKNNLKTYLQSQDEFRDYNFEASGISTLLDILSYNTYYNAFRESIHRDLSYCGLPCRNRNPRGIKTRFILE